jgi:hypothetical protein
MGVRVNGGISLTLQYKCTSERVALTPVGAALTVNSNKLGRAPPYSSADVKDVSPVV